MRIIVAAAALAAVGIGGPAMAQSQSEPTYTGIYGNLGWSGTDTQGLWTHSITGRIGGRYGKYLGVEGELSGGLSTDHYTFAPSTSVGIKQTLAGAAYGVGFLPLGPNFDLLARVGYGASRYDVEPNGLASYHVSEHGLRYGAGAQYFMGANGLRVDWTRHDMDNFTDTPGFFPPGRRADVWSVSFAHKF
jgi:outer membrane immunogenic protein